MGVTLGTLVACSPYIYKSEIAEFGTGVKDVSAAYDDGMKAYAQERSDRQELEWRFARAKLAKTRGCDIGIGPGAVFKEPCELRPTGNSAGEGGAGESVLPRTRLELVKPLSRYAAALVAVTNAKDREELIAAQANLKTSIDGLTTEVGVPALPVEPLSAIARALLDQERYETLKRSVVAADPY